MSPARSNYVIALDSPDVILMITSSEKNIRPKHYRPIILFNNIQYNNEFKTKAKQLLQQQQQYIRSEKRLLHL